MNARTQAYWCGVFFTGVTGDKGGMGMPHRTDRELAHDYVAGDARAFKLIVRRHRQRMYFVARNYARDEQDAQDIVQEALFRASKSMHTYRGEAKLSTWLHRTVTNVAIDHQRRAQRRGPVVSLDDDATMPQDSNRYLAHDPTATLEHFLALRQAVAKLPAAQRKALLLIDVYGMSVEGAATELGVRPGTIKSRRHRAREFVASAIEAQ